MAPNSEQIDQIVSLVLARLEPKLAALEKPAGAAGALALNDRVVSLAQLEKRLHGIGQVTVRPGAIVTPAVRDLLKERQIELQVAAQTAVDSQTLPQIFVGAAETNYCTKPLRAALASAGLQAKPLKPHDAKQAIAEACEAIVQHHVLAVVLTDQPAALACLANRHPNVRATMAQTPACVVEAVRTAGANLLTVNPQGKNVLNLRQMVEQFCQDFPRVCPKWLT